ncbi:hypothetical protein [Pontibacter roseus]|uniref:hypothetical protein n=1 Tax=Pontibacter roseus TaxID=336989 RepID=UPI0012FCC1E3|nr:hypothetical protein [Pontibacter roseus]
MVLTKWLRAVNSREYRSGISYFCRIIRKHSAASWMVDATRLCAPPLKDQNWTVNKISDSLLQTPLNRIAFVTSNDLFIEVVTEKIKEKLHQKTSNQILMESFRTYSQAFDWLFATRDKEGLFREDVIQGQH